MENLPRSSSTVLRTINGISTIRFPVNYLRFHVDTLGIPLLAETSESLLSEDLAHELYHIRVGKKFPFAFKKSIEANDDPYKYSKDWGERAARLFSLFYISHRDKPNFLTAVGDFMAELAIKQKISFYKQHKDI